MYQNLDVIQLPFTDFCILALLLGVLYSVSVFEAWLSPSGQSAAGISKMNRKYAATYAFFGIFFTLVAGILTEADREYPDISFLTVPIFFIAHWAFFHYRSSELIDPRIVHDQITQKYQEAVFQVIAERTPVSFSADEVRALALESNLYTSLLEKGQPLFKSTVPIPILSVINSLIPTAKQTEELLSELVEQGRISKNENGTFTMRIVSTKSTV